MKTSRVQSMWWVTLMVMGMVSLSAMAADNLIPDPQFAKIKFTPLTYESSWMWYQINGPSETTFVPDQNAISMTGGKTFLHSSKFPVTAGQKYKISLTAKGTGKVSVEVLWWRPDGGTATPHRTIPIEPTEVNGDEITVDAIATASDNAAKAYIRVVVEDGTVTISKPSVTLAE